MKLFPEIKPISECEVKPTVRRLKSDEREICRRLLKKYGGSDSENYARMAGDIKLNYLQWSKGQVTKAI